jgi:hypothetical protein
MWRDGSLNRTIPRIVCSRSCGVTFNESAPDDGAFCTVAAYVLSVNGLKLVLRS